MIASANCWPSSKSLMSARTNRARAATSGFSPARLRSASAIIAGARSIPTTSIPARAMGQLTRPVPLANSSTGPPLSRARATQNSISPWEAECTHVVRLGVQSSLGVECSYHVSSRE